MKIQIRYIFNLFLFFLPFTQALTINIFFPLKISELLLFALLLVVVQIKLDQNYINVLKKTQLLPLFLFVVTVSFLVNIFWKYEYPLKSLLFRIGPISDSFLRLVYIYINIFAFFISIFFLGKNISGLKFWVKGAVVAAVYSWYLVISSALGLPYLKLFGMEEQPQEILGIIRSGTFKEGNFFSLYLLLSSTIAFYIKKVKTGWFLIASILTTFSTIGLVSALLFIVVYLKEFIFRKRSLKIFLIISPMLVIGFFFFIKSDLYKKYVYDKIFTPIETLTPSNLSKVDRYLTGNIAFKEGLDNPFLGVGPNNYSSHYDHYNSIKTIVNNHTEWSINYFARENRRAIPNNVYLEVWAEYGLIGFVLFISFLVITVLESIRLKNRILVGGLLAMYFSLNAFPSFIMLFLWVYLAFPYALRYNKLLQWKDKHDTL